MRLVLKSHVRGYYRTLGGKTVHVKPHEDRRRPAVQRETGPSLLDLMEEAPEVPTSPATYYDDTYTGPRYTYGLMARPAGYGRIPEGYIIGSTKPSDRYRHGTIQYPRPLTPDEVRSYELVDVDAVERKAREPSHVLTDYGSTLDGGVGELVQILNEMDVPALDMVLGQQADNAGIPLEKVKEEYQDLREKFAIPAGVPPQLLAIGTVAGVMGHQARMERTDRIDEVDYRLWIETEDGGGSILTYDAETQNMLGPGGRYPTAERAVAAYDELIRKAKRAAGGEVEESPELPIAVSPDDIPFREAEHAYYNVSMDPERRARGVQEEYVRDMFSTYEGLLPKAQTDRQKDVLAAEMKRYQEGYIKRVRALLAAESRVASPMVTGPANFPVERNRRRAETADRRRGDYLEWRKRAVRAMERHIQEARDPEQVDSDDWKQLKSSLLESLAMVAAIQDGKAPGYNPTLFVNSIQGKIKRLARNGRIDLVDRALDFIRDTQAMRDRPLITARNSIWKMGNLARNSRATMQQKKQEAAADPTPTREYPGGVRVVHNRELNRVQFLFPGKPSAEVRAALKHRGFRWAPSKGAWQRQLTRNGIWAAEHLAQDLFGGPE